MRGGYPAGSACWWGDVVCIARHAGPAATATSRTSWQGSLVERALRALAADYRRPTGPVTIAFLLVVTALLTSTTTGPLNGWAPLLALLATAPIAVIRRFPATVIGLVLGVSDLFLLMGRLSWPVPAMAGWVIALAACPMMLSRTAAIRVFVLTELVVAADQLRDLSEREVLARERASIARELHDVVAHHVSMIAVRAGTAPYAIGGLPQPGQEAFAEIAEEARTALTELRIVLGVLRDPAQAAEAVPQPRIADVADLLSRVRSAGTEVSAELTGPVRDLPEPVELCGYSIVQEAVTNAGRHAPGSRVSVGIGYQPAALTVTVRNTAPDRMRPAQRGPLPAAGYGLVGLRERVAMLGGEITAGPAGGGGFAVAAVLPAPAAQAGRAGG